MTDNFYAELIFAVLTLTSAVPAFAQSSPADGPWSGQIQCQLDVQQQDYVRHEVQTWTLTGNMPVSKNGDMRIYPATWTATGQGGIQRTLGQRASMTQWNLNVPSANASIAMFVRASDRQFIIRIWQRPTPAYNAARGTRQIAENGIAQQPGAINSTVHEWMLPWIEAKPGANISGKLPVPTESLGADLTPPGISPTAVCVWQFSRPNTDSKASSAAGGASAGTSAKTGTSDNSVAGGSAAGAAAGAADGTSAGASAKAGTSDNSVAGGSAKGAAAGAAGGASAGASAKAGTADNSVAGGSAKGAAAGAAGGASAGASAKAGTADSSVAGGGAKSGAAVAGGAGSAGSAAATPTGQNQSATLTESTSTGKTPGASSTPSDGAAPLATDSQSTNTGNETASNACWSDIAKYYEQMEATLSQQYEKLIQDAQATLATQGITAAERKNLEKQISELQKEEQKNLGALAVQKKQAMAGVGKASQVQGRAADDKACQAWMDAISNQLANLDSSILSAAKQSQTNQTSGVSTKQQDVFPTRRETQSISTNVISPVLVRVAPNSAAPGTHVSVTLIGKDTNFSQGSTTVEFVSTKAIMDAVGMAADSYAAMLAATSILAGGGGGGGSGGTSGSNPAPKSLKASSVSVTSTTRVVAELDVPQSAFTGSYAVLVKTNSEAALLQDGFGVASGSIPTPPHAEVTQVAPSWADIGATNVKVTITGHATHFSQQGTTVELWFAQAYLAATYQKLAGTQNVADQINGLNGNAVSGGTSSEPPIPVPTVKASVVAVPSTTLAIATFDIGPSLPPGAYIVVAKTGSEQAMLNSGFTLSAPVYATPANATTTMAPEGSPLASATVVPLVPALAIPSLVGITAITPNSATQGTNSLEVTLTGRFTNFTQASTKANFGPGIKVAELKVEPPTSVIATLNIDPSAAAGPHAVTLNSGKETVSLSDGFTVMIAMTATQLLLTPSMPGITQVSPNTALQETAGLTVTLTGFATHFAQGSTTADFGPGITVSRLTVDSPTQATAQLNVDVAAAASARTVRLKTGTETAALASGFTVTVPPPPAITGVTPNSVEPGESNLTVTLSAQSTHFAQGTTTLDFGPGVTLTSLRINSATTATAVLNIAGSAQATARAVTATTGTEIAKTSYPHFSVTYDPGQIVQISPKEAPQGKQFDLTLTGIGTHFSPSTTVSIGGLCQFQGISVPYRSQATAHLTCPATSALGLQNVSVTTNGKTISLNNAFTITPQPDLFGHSLQQATGLGSISNGTNLSRSGVISTQFASDWFYFSYGSGQTLRAIITLKDVLSPSDFAVDVYGATSPYVRRNLPYEPNRVNDKQLIVYDDGTHGGFIQIRANRWDARSAKFTLSVLGDMVVYANTMPNLFSFSVTHMAPPLIDFESNTVTISGINVDVPISITAGDAAYSINGGEYRYGSGTVREGDRICLRAHLYPLDVSRSFTVKVGDFSATWTISRLP